uniref:DBF4-type domain-containing protein n=3 Tax=Oryctolagus cuniculus TaxID=9986 RepID=G1SX64_RABIT
MQRKQGYCSYCRVQYTNLEQHLFSAQHRSLTRQSRRQMCTSSLMERFLQDVLRHHPYNYQENRSMQNEAPTNTDVPPDTVHMDESIPEEKAEDAAAPHRESPSESSEPAEESHSRPSKLLEHGEEVSVRPSVIQKLEKGQQQSLVFVPKVESSTKKFNPVDTGQATNKGKSLIRHPVICNAPARGLPESSCTRPVITKMTRLPLAAQMGSASKCDPNKPGKYDVPSDGVSRNIRSSSNLETSSVSYEKHKESNRKSLRVNSDKLVTQKGLKSQGKTSSGGFKSHESMGAESSERAEFPEVAANPAQNLSVTDMPSNVGIFEDAIPRHQEEFFSNMDCTEEEKHLGFSKSVILKQKGSMSTEMKFDCDSVRSVSDQPQEAVQGVNLWKEDGIDQEESRGSETSFDCSSFFHSLTSISKVAAKETNLSEKLYSDLQYKNIKPYVSELSCDCDDSPQVGTSQSQVIVRGESLQNIKPVSLVDQSYDSSGSEMNFDCDASLPTTSDYPMQSVKEEDLPNEMPFSLVDKNYGSSSSEVSADTVFPRQSVIDRPPVIVTETKLWKKSHVVLVDKNYGSSCSEASYDCDVPPQSVVDPPQLTVKGKKSKHRHARLKKKKRKSRKAKRHLHSDVSLEAVADEPQRDAEEINLLKEKNADLMDMNCESHGPEMGFHADARFVADQSEVAVNEVNPPNIDNDLENQSVHSSISNISFDSHAFSYLSVYDQPQGALGEVNLKELNVDMEVKSCGSSTSELTFDSDPPVLSVSNLCQLDVERLKEERANLEDES